MKRPSPPQRRAYAYMRLSVDKEGGAPQSIEAQRAGIREYARREKFEIVEEFADAGFSGKTDKRPEFRRMIAQATQPDRPVDVVLMFRFNRWARNMRLFLNTIGDLEDAGIRVISITENFGTGRSQFIGRAITAMIAEQQAHDASVMTRKSRRENARQGFFNGGPVPFGYRSYVARQDAQKARKKLEIAPEEASVVRQIFAWADMGRGGRWIVAQLHGAGHTLRGRKFSNSAVSGILKGEVYTGVYHDRTADDDGVKPDVEDAIPVPCPQIIDRDQFDRVAATRANRNPRSMAPHVAAGTTLLVGLARCGMPGCQSGLTVRTGKSGRYAYYTCNDRVNRGGSCGCPPIRREELDSAVVRAIERQLLAPERLQSLLAGLLDASIERRTHRQEELARARADRTRIESAIRHLVILIEDGTMKPRDPVFAERMAENKSRLATATARINTLEAQLASGARAITPETITKFGEMLSAKLRDDDPTLRSAYLKMFVEEVRVSDSEIIIAGSRSALEAGASTGKPVKPGLVPNFDREWCRLQDSNL